MCTHINVEHKLFLIFKIDKQCFKVEMLFKGIIKIFVKYLALRGNRSTERRMEIDNFNNYVTLMQRPSRKLCQSSPAVSLS